MKEKVAPTIKSTTNCKGGFTGRLGAHHKRSLPEAPELHRPHLESVLSEYTFPNAVLIFIVPTPDHSTWGGLLGSKLRKTRYRSPLTWKNGHPFVSLSPKCSSQLATTSPPPVALSTSQLPPAPTTVELLVYMLNSSPCK